MFYSYIPEDYFKFYASLLKILFIWPLDKTNRFYTIHGIFTIIVNATFILFIVSEIYYLFKTPSKEQIIYALCAILLHIIGFAYSVFIRSQHQDFTEFFSTLKQMGVFYKYNLTDWQHLAAYDSYLSYEDIQLKWKKQAISANLCPKMMKVFTKNMALFRKYAYFFILAYFILVIVDLVGTYAGMFLYSVFYEKEPNIPQEQLFALPAETYFPFSIHTNVYNYAFALFLQCICSIYIITVLMVCISIIVPIQINLLYQTYTIMENITYISETTAVTSRETELLHKIQFISCLEKINRIYTSMELIESAFHKMVLYKYCTGAFTTCMSTLLFSYETNAFVHYCSLLSIIAQFVDPMVNCWISQTLRDELQNLGDWIFNTVEWISLSPSYRRDLAFIIFRFQKPINLTIGKFFAIDLNFFINYVSKTYSLYTLISQSKQHKQN